MDDFLDQLAAAVSDSEDLESPVRPLLGLLESITGMESTYLTMIDLQHNVQHIVFARNTQALIIPEGLSVPWGDTLCKRAIDEGPRMWTMCQAAGVIRKRHGHWASPPI